MFAFGGIYPATLVVPALACAALAVSRRPGVFSNSPTPVLDRWLLVLLGAVAVTLAPLPRSAVAHLSPAAIDVERAFALIPPQGARPLTINPRDTTAALVLLAGIGLLFVTARRIFEAGGVRTMARVVSLSALVLSGVALAQDATAHGLMYWHFAPAREGPYPFGPFINRNHFATWAMMVAPLCLGYLAAHAVVHSRNSDSRTWRVRLSGALDERTWLLSAAALLLVVATAASLSRSGLLGLAAAVLCAMALLRQDGAAAGTAKLTGTAVSFAVLAIGAILGIVTEVGPYVLADRFGRSGVALADRLAIWHDTLPVVRAFWLSGTGVGTFQSAMAVYQRSKPEVIFNQAHNHYLQLAAEGGLLVSIPAVMVMWAFVRAGWQSLQADCSPMYFLRAGAAAGLAGVAVQSFWETGLTIPANAALAAVMAAVVVHVPSGTVPEGR